MIKKWIDKVRNTRRPAVQAACHLTRKEHSLRASMIASSAQKIIQKLQQAGFSAYIVGGAVRDLLLGRTPKDFDIATDAKPEEIQHIFRRSRIIGRRFQIVHVTMGAERFEVTTFRGGNEHTHNEHGRIMRDNVFGTQIEDAARRDFTCNALYFDPIQEILVDYHQGLNAIQNRRLVMIGDPIARFQEDPMRILRAVRLSAKLNLTIDPDILSAIKESAHLIKQEPVARLFDEITKELFCGHSLKCLQQLKNVGIPADTHPLFSMLNEQNEQHHQLINHALSQTDERVQTGKPVSIGFILAALLWGNTHRQWQANLAEGMKTVQALQVAISQIKDSTEKGWGVPHRFASVMREIWQMQSQFTITQGRRPLRLLQQARFRAAYDFLILRCQCGEVSPENVRWWTEFQAADEHQKNNMLKPKKSGTQTKPRHHRRPKKAPLKDNL